jgi:hypothetical protein
MKFVSAIFTVVALLVGNQLGFAQGFVNLDFEDAIPPSNLTPGWTTYYGTANNPTYEPAGVAYDDISLGGPSVFLEDKNDQGTQPIQGNDSVLLFGAEGIIYVPIEDQLSASIGQNGTVPTTAQSMTFWCSQSQWLNGSSSLQVTFNGLPIDYLVTGSTAAYTIYAADISAYAGKTGQLLFTAPVDTVALLDNIQFSSSSVPEPSEFALSALGALLLGFRRRRNFMR